MPGDRRASRCYFARVSPRSPAAPLVFAFAVVGLAVALAAPSPAHATPEEEAELLLKKGHQARIDHDDARALELFEEADRLAPSPRTKAQVGLTLHGLERWLASHRALSEALRSPRHPWIAKNRSALETTRTFVEEQLGVLELRGAPGGTVTIDGEPPVPLTPPKTRVVLEPGPHRLVFAWGDGADARAEVDAPKGQVTPLELGALRLRGSDDARASEGGAGAAEPGGPAGTRLEPRAPLDDPHATRRALGWTAVTVGGFGLVAAAVGIGLAVSGAGTLSDLGCFDGDEFFACVEARGQRDAGTALAIGAGLAGAGLLTTGVVLLVSTPSEGSGAVVSVAGRF
jgi:hypothetical protein